MARILSVKTFKQPIPYIYRHPNWCKGDRELFISYVRAYVEKNYPEWEFVTIEDKGRIVVLRKKG